jgi:subtilisin-like proprotein convertase family protein
LGFVYLQLLFNCFHSKSPYFFTAMKIILPFFLLILCTQVLAQKEFPTDNFWHNISESDLQNLPLERRIIPISYRTLALDIPDIQSLLSQAPLRDLSQPQKSKIILSVPMPDGSVQSFRVYYAPLMPDKLADRYPMIRTYVGQGIDDPTAYMKFDITQFGFHAMIRSASQGSVFIDPYFFGDNRYYISYYKKDFAKNSLWECTFDEVNNAHPIEENDNRFAGDCNFRTYTLALACTGEYASFHGGTVANVMAAYNTSMNRVNGVFEIDCSLTMVLHPNTDTLIFLNAGSDPYTNGDGGAMLGQNITTCNARIGSANYDIGHVFSTGGGGVAYLQSVCGSNKAGGVTGSGSPVGDPFDIDYVAHEMGHQYGGNHTQNNSCNRNNSTAMEPGSASTIMGYAGICNPNVQSNSDAYYHAISLQEIGNFTTGGGNSCATTINPANSTPTANAGNDYTVPKSTPLVLTGSATDPEGLTGLTYCWEQMDNAVATMPPVATNTGGPAFRSLTPVAENHRYLPALSAVVANTTPTWEVLPSVARTMNWRFTVRDNAEPGGCTEEDNMIITVNGTAGPFIVTAPNTAVTWNVGENQTITWNVAGTTASPVSCANVKITLSLDGGFTYPVTLLASTTNDGSETITVPNNPTTLARVRVESVGNIFYDISNNNFTIVASIPDFALDATPASQQVCSPANAVYTVSVTSILGFNAAVTLSVSGMPPGLAASFSNNPVVPTANSILTFSNTGSVIPGTYSITINGTAVTGTKTKIIQLTILNGSIGNVTLSAPANGATGVALTPNFNWTGGSGATAFQIDIATDNAFNNIVYTNNTISGSPFTLATVLSSQTTYYWRIRGLNSCGNGNFSSVYSFTTAAISCTNFASTNVPINISASGTPTITSSLVIPATGNIIDINVTNLNITHTWTEDLVIRITSPGGTTVELVNAICGDNNNMNLNFDSQSGNTYASIPCPPTGGGTYQPLESLDAFNGQAANGTWTLTVLDQANQDGGSLNSWGITVCVQSATPLTATASSTDVSCNNGSNGSITVSASGGTPPYQYSLEGGGYVSSGNFTGLAAGTYSVTVRDAQNATTSVSVTITQPTGINITPSSSNISCNGQNDGTATVSVSGGVTPYSYLWNNNATTASISSLSAGTYICTVTDANSCTKSQSITITQPNAINITASSSNVSCNGGNDGTANVSVSGGNSPYSYFWNNNATTASISSLTAGTYTCTVTDNNNCTKTQSVSITQPAGMNITASGSNVSCNGGNDGTANVSVTGGNAPYTYLWNNNFTTPSIISLTAGTYTCTVTDVNNCIKTQSVTITQPSGMNISPTTSNVSCNGGNDGTASVSVNGGNAPYTYIWNTNATSASISSIAAGTYTCTITDLNNCTKSQSVTITQPSPVNTIVTTNNISCNGGNNGSATIIASGGVGPYSYLWDNNATTATINALTAGVYSCTVTDNNNCIKVQSVTITQPAPINASSTATNIDCNGGNNSSASVVATGGSAPYTYLWNNNATTATINSLNAGTYACTITDENNCTGTQSVTITQPAPIITTISSNNVTCNGVANGTASVSVTGGNAPYTYLWSNNATGSTVNSLAAGTYTCTVTDVTNCTKSQIVTINQPAPVNAMAQVSNVACNGSSNGMASLSVSGGMNPYTYLWSNNATSATINNLAAATYSYTVTDNNNCATTGAAVVSQPAPLVLAGTSTNIACNNNATGTAAIVVSGGTFPYSYLWSNGLTTANIGNLIAGTYTCTVTDNNGCTDTQSFIITQTAGLSVSVNSNNISCNGLNNGNIALTPSGGTLPYTYFWSNNANTSSLNNLSAGTYTCTVTDINGCSGIESVTITQPSVLLTGIQSADISCNGVNDGIASVYVSGGTMPYSYLWSNNATVPAISSLSPGTYTCTISDENNCSKVESVIITQPMVLNTTLSAHDVSCFGLTDGNISLTANGGVNPYTYLWNTNATVADLNNIPAGFYSCTVTDENGCTKTEALTISQPSALVATIDAENISCFGMADGYAIINTSGGMAPYEYDWSNNGTLPTLSNLVAGTYICTTTDMNGCTLTTSTVITEPAPLTVTTSFTNVTCNSTTNGTAAVEANGGTAPYSYLWNNNQTTDIINSLSAGTYTCTITDVNGCSSSSAVTILQTSELSVTAITTPITCFGMSNGAASVTALGGNSVYSYLWNNNATTSLIEELSAGQYTCLVTDISGCTSEVTVQIEAPELLTSFANTENISCFGAEDGQAAVSVSGGVLPYNYFWSNASTDAYLTSLAPGIYACTVTDFNGCTVEEAMEVTTPAPIELAQVSLDVTCFGLANGTASVSATGGTPPFSYLWNTNDEVNTIDDLVAGEYICSVTDINGCTEIATVEISTPDQLTLVLSSYNVHCFNGNDGSATIMPSGGVAPYTYLWNNNANTSTIENLVAGNYSCTITDDNDCMVNANTSITSPDEMIVQLTGDNADAGMNNGKGSISILGGVPAYDYQWSNGVSGAEVADLAPGTYFITATDDNDCQVLGSLTIEEEEAIIYCNAYGENSDAEWIDQVNLGTLVNTSGNNGGYGDFSMITTELIQGDLVTANLIPGYNNTSYPEYWRIYIDYNIDGDFFDAEELVAEGTAAGIIALNFVVPEITNPGTTRIRITMSRDLSGYYCELFATGEVEDYSVKISDMAINVEEPASGISSSSLSLTPNPAADLVTLSFEADQNGTTWLTLTDELGRMVDSRQFQYSQGRNETLISLKTLPSGVYFVSLNNATSQLTTKLVVIR